MKKMIKKLVLRYFLNNIPITTFMGSNPEAMIKAAISETIIEEMFRDLGFLVFKLGQEHTINPLVQFQKFIKTCGGEFTLEKRGRDYIKPIDLIRELPDFLIIDKQGKAGLVEVKYRRFGELDEYAYGVFDTYPETIIVVINSEITREKFLKCYKKIDEKKFNLLKKTHFHTHMLSDLDKEKVSKEDDIAILPLEEWLKDEFDISDDLFLTQYSRFIEKWIPHEKLNNKNDN